MAFDQFRSLPAVELIKNYDYIVISVIIIINIVKFVCEIMNKVLDL